jgi:hypothetical protein
MRQAHEEVIAPHGIPVEGKGMLVVVALVLLDEKARFDAPAVAGAQVAALMDLVLADRLAGEPGVTRGFGDGPGLVIDPLPAFLTDHYVQLEMLTPVRTEGIVDVVDPAEVLWRRPQQRCEACGFRAWSAWNSCQTVDKSLSLSTIMNCQW